MSPKKLPKKERQRLREGLDALLTQNQEKGLPKDWLRFRNNLSKDEMATEGNVPSIPDLFTLKEKLFVAQPNEVERAKRNLKEALTKRGIFCHQLAFALQNSLNELSKPSFAERLPAKLKLFLRGWQKDNEAPIYFETIHKAAELSGFASHNYIRDEKNRYEKEFNALKCELGRLKRRKLSYWREYNLKEIGSRSGGG